MQNVMAQYMLLQRRRINAGKKAGGGNFKKYDQDYEDRKRRAGRMGENYWLRLSGDMLKSQKIRIKQSGKNNIRARVEFSGNRPGNKFRVASKRKKSTSSSKTKLTLARDSKNTVANALIAAVNNKLRPFVGVSHKENESLLRVFNEQIRKRSRSTT